MIKEPTLLKSRWDDDTGFTLSALVTAVGADPLARNVIENGIDIITWGIPESRTLVGLRSEKAVLLPRSQLPRRFVFEVSRDLFTTSPKYKKMYTTSRPTDRDLAGIQIRPVAILEDGEYKRIGYAGMYSIDLPINPTPDEAKYAIAVILSRYITAEHQRRWRIGENSIGVPNAFDMHYDNCHMPWEIVKEIYQFLTNQRQKKVIT